MSYDYAYYSGEDLVWPVKPNKPFLRTAPNAADCRKYADELDVYCSDMTEYHKDYEEMLQEVIRRQKEFSIAIRYDYALSKEQFFVLWEQAKYYAKSEDLKIIGEEIDRLYNFMVRYISAK